MIAAYIKKTPEEVALATTFNALKVPALFLYCFRLFRASSRKSEDFEYHFQVRLGKMENLRYTLFFYVQMKI